MRCQVAHDGFESSVATARLGEQVVERDRAEVRVVARSGDDRLLGFDIWIPAQRRGEHDPGRIVPLEHRTDKAASIAARNAGEASDVTRSSYLGLVATVQPSSPTANSNGVTRSSSSTSVSAVRARTRSTRSARMLAARSLVDRIDEGRSRARCDAGNRSRASDPPCN